MPSFHMLLEYLGLVLPSEHSNVTSFLRQHSLMLLFPRHEHHSFPQRHCHRQTASTPVWVGNDGVSIKCLLRVCSLVFFSFFLYSLNHHQASPTQSTFTAQLPPFLDFVSGDSTASSIFSFVHIYITMVSKLAFNSLALLSSSSSVLAQFQGTTYNQTGPFLLQVVTADDDALVGKYLTTCHAGATITGLCIGSNDVSNFTLSFYYNYTIVNGQPSKTGFLTWSLPVPGAEGPLSLSEPMSLMFEPGSNVAVPMFTVGLLLCCRHSAIR